ncbi:MAG: CoB--CoM heterodisulfide reductase iron-sulfur subunit A family protein [Chloroflexi bacterium]|nr:CoB--CoM heterodisulfide reductase iron-sulfur subunit A family protein [Chloroflexota bacterium]
MPNCPKVVVLGGGIAGLAAAANLARRGAQVALIERDAVLGGNALTVCCKAVEGECQLCGGCLLPDQIDEVRRSDLVEVWTQTTVTRVTRENGGFLLRLRNGSGADMSLSADALVLATGFDHVDARTKGPYGYGILPQVITGQDMEKRLCDEGQAAYDGLGLKKVAFIQCVGSRDEHAGRGYCSQVCCRYALRLARLLKSRLPEVEIALFKMDLQHAGRDMAAAWRAISSMEGVRVVAGLPAVIRRSTENPKRVTFFYNDILADDLAQERAPGTKQEDFDLVVLSVGMQPRADAGRVAELFGVNRDAYGFFSTRDQEGVSTILPGVFVAGSCQAPRSMSEAVAHARQAAEACYRYLQEKGS